MFDLIVTGGTVVDGSGRPGYRADVGVIGETIHAIGDLSHASARRVIEATGLIVSPGFIDTHTHSEGALLTDPQHAYGLRQGITTEFLGIDGMSYAPLSPTNYRLYRHWLSGLLGHPPDDLDMSSVTAFRSHYHRKVAVNTAYLVPHATVRLEVLGFRDAPLRGKELDQARRLVREGLEQGAVGFSTGSRYYPGPWADTAELVELGKVVREGRGIYMCEPRAGLLDRAHGGSGVLEALEVARQTDVPAPLRPLPDRPGDGGAHRPDHGAHRPRQGARRGCHLRHLPLPDRQLGAAEPPAERGPGGRARRHPSPTRGSIPASQDRPVPRHGARRRPRRDHLSRTCRRTRTSRAGPCGTSRPSEGSPWVRCCARSCSTRASASATSRRRPGAPRCGASSAATTWSCSRDPTTWSAATSRPAGSFCHPRCYGAFPRFLGRLRRTFGTLSLEKTVHTMTDRPARRFGLTRRGRIERGFFADLVVFDAERVMDNATYDDPQQFPTGIPFVVVNGAVAVDHERCTGLLAGQAVP